MITIQAIVKIIITRYNRRYWYEAYWMNVNPDETGYEPINPSPTTPTSSPENYITLVRHPILEHDVNLTGDVLEKFIQEKNQRTKSKNKQRKRRRNKIDMSLLKEVMPQK